VKTQRDTAMQMLPLMAATSFEHRGPQCLLTLGRSTSPPLGQFPVRVCSCPLCIINRLWTHKETRCEERVNPKRQGVKSGLTRTLTRERGCAQGVREGLWTLRGEYEYGYSWGRPKWNIISCFRGYSMIFHLIRNYIPF